MKIAVSSPYPLDSPQGNSVTALRIASLLEGASACHLDPPEEPDVLIALHARRNAALIKSFASRQSGFLIVLLTGTDLYKDIPEGDPEALESLRLADRIVVAHDRSVSDVPHEFQQKVRVCWSSQAVAIPPNRPSREKGLVTIIGHLRKVKDPFLTAQSAEGLGLRVVQLGRSLDPTMTVIADEFVETRSDYEWLGNQPFEKVIHWLLKSSVTVNSSLMEGGAHSVIEAILCGTPVLATDVSGNRGLLGESYSGYFPVGDVTALRGLLEKTASDNGFLHHLTEQVIERQPLFSADREHANWLSVLAEIRDSD